MKCIYEYFKKSTNTQLRRRGMEGFCDSPYPSHQKRDNSLKSHLPKRTLRKHDKDAKVSSQLMASGGVVGGE